ncbi:MAG: DUF2721 domain-containing protein [Candidatus Sericytochromatia bacterium]
MNAENILDLTKAIQLALAPVFLLTGIAGILNVMASRLSRIIDRGRSLTEDPKGILLSEKDFIIKEIKNLEKRRHLASMAITCCTISALLICMVIPVLFIGVLLSIHLSLLIGILFTASTLVLVIGLAFFLREVHLATKTIRIPIPKIE